MRKSIVVLAAVVAVGAVAIAPAAAQDIPKTTFSVDVKVTPKKAGTKKDPQGVRITAKGKWNTEAGFDPPIITGADAFIGRGLVWNAGAYPKCTKKILDRDGPKGCPKKSIVGKGRATAWADNVVTHPDAVFVNGGAGTTYAYITLYFPSLVQEAVPVKSTKMVGKWAYKESIRVPENLQVVAGVPIRLSSGKLEVGGKPYAKNYIYTDSCPKGGWKYKVTMYYLYDLIGKTSKDTTAGSVPCTR